jgi:hypothetical protein
MAAVGATEWFEGQSVPHLKVENAEDLVLGHYPYEFVQDVREKSGALFFASRRERTRHVMFSGMPTVNVPSFGGTMMPFYYSAYTGRFHPDDFQVHESVATWVINSDGSVDVKEAAILLATDRPKGSLIAGKIFLEPVLVRTVALVAMGHHDLFDLLETAIRGVSGGRGELYAVVLISNATQIEGIVIIEEAMTGIYVKIGNFSIGPGYDIPIPSSEVVD